MHIAMCLIAESICAMPSDRNRHSGTDGRYPEGSGNISLFGIAALAELRGDHPKGVPIGLIVNKNRHVAIEVGDPTILLAECQHRRDMRDTFGKERQLHLGHKRLPIR